ncbi:MAG: homoserine dehydrogenase [Proteobacteria bacterium]|nr:homoserine dehydrogenase [Pseudomonadota bacterium]NIS67479.1 homoserine dehydrogenase [Pseudomonadota bacterium]
MRGVQIGLIGFGTVGSGVVKVLEENGSLIEKRLGQPLILKRIADLDLDTDRGVSVDHVQLTRNALEVIEDPEISIVIELIGGYEPARSFILNCFRQKKHVVTANKALLAIHGDEIFREARRHGVDINFEASVGGGIPIVRSLREGLVANRITSLFGILNGTSNYILTKMTDGGGEFGQVLQEAQEKGFAEADPSMDIDGIDPAHKLAILLSLACGGRVRFDRIYTEGLSKISPLDIQYSLEFGYKVKLLAIAKIEASQVEARVHPTLVPIEHPLSAVNGVDNAIFVTGDVVGPTMFYGQGAGQMPTASAVVSDVVELARNVLFHSAGRVSTLSHQDRYIKAIGIKDIERVVTRWYMRFSVVDKPGVLSRISGILGKNRISIAAVIQKGRQAREAVPVVMMTHEARGRDVIRALKAIDQLPVVLDETVRIRVEDKLS